MIASFVRRVGAWAAVVAFSASFGLGWSAASHPGADSDADCGQVERAGSHPRAQFEAVKASEPAAHCVFCHWQRTVSGASLSAVPSADCQLQPVGSRALPASRSPRSAALDQHSSRGPPSVI